jgi:hypothetical protein
MVEHGDNILPGDIQGAIMFDLYQNLNDYLMLNITSNLSAEKLEEFNGLITEKPSEEELQKFLKKNTDYQKMVKLSCEQLRNAYLENKHNSTSKK